MAREIRQSHRLIAVAAMVAALGTVPVAASAAPTPSPAQTGGALTVPLPPGVTLKAGTYDVTVRGGGAEVTTRVTVPERRPSPGAVPPGGTAGSNALLLVLVILVILGLLIAAGAVVVTGRRRRPEPVGGRPAGPTDQVETYHALLRLIDDGQYKAALPRLTRLEATLPDPLRTDARFFIAFALYQLGHLDEAEHALAALHREQPAHEEVAAMLAHLRVMRRDFDGAEPLLASLAGLERLTVTTRKLYGIVEYQRALAALRDGDIDAAATLFEQVGRLGDFRDKVPADLRNRHVLLGARALLEKDVPAARSHFGALESAAGRLPADRRDDLLASAKLGLALAAWVEDATGGADTIEKLLVEAANKLDPGAPLTGGWPAGDEDVSLADSLADAMDEAGPGSRRERDRTLRDIHFLRGMLVLRAWANNTDLAPTRRFRVALERFARARALDPTFADVYLVVGLLVFHLSAPRWRADAVSMLRVARKRGAHDPELVKILNDYDVRAPDGERSTAAMLDILDSYRLNPTMRASIRERLLRQWAHLGRWPTLDQWPDLPGGGPTRPTIDELHDRAELLVARVRLLGDARQHGDLDAALHAADDLGTANQRLAEQARAVEESEAAVLALIADTLLAEPGR
jgi:hypothetical protein